MTIPPSTSLAQTDEVNDFTTTKSAGAISQAVNRWANDLTDVTGRNRLLYYRELKRGTLNLTNANRGTLSQLLSSAPGQKTRLRRLFANTATADTATADTDTDTADTTSSEPGPDSAEPVSDALTRARAISRKALENFEERGISTLFIVRGIATWSPQGSSATPAAPVLMCPITLHRRGASEADFDLSLDGEWSVNGALLHSLAQEFGLDATNEDLLGSFLADSRLDDQEAATIFNDLTDRAHRVPDFSIDQTRLLVGNFMYKKMPMVNDLRNNIDVLAQNDLIAAIAGDEPASQRLRSHHTKDVDSSYPDQIPPTDEYLVLDADSSQNVAINAALAGESFVLQGPPGTGKSQTIVNLIATMMARNRSVLFVAEKRAAIDAVAKRLTKVGLDDFVMDLHGGTVSRRELARQLDQTLTKIGQTPSTSTEELHNRLGISRTKLAGYCEALHVRQEPWGVSFFDVQNRLLELNVDGSASGKRLQLAPSIVNQIDEDAMRDLCRDLNDWADFIEPIVTRTSAWADAQITTQTDAKSVMELLFQLQSATTSDRVSMRRVQAELDLPRLPSLGEWAEQLASISELQEVYSHMSDNFLNVDMGAIADALTPLSQGSFSRFWAQLFNGRYRTAKREMSELLNSKSELRPAEIFQLAEKANAALVRWRELFPEQSFKAPSALANTLQCHNELAQLIEKITKYLPKLYSEDRYHNHLLASINDLISDGRVLNQLPRLAEIERKAADSGITWFLDLVKSKELQLNEIAGAFESAWLWSVRREILATDQYLGSFDSDRHDRNVANFRDADNEHLGQNPARIRRRIAEHATLISNKHREQYKLIRREANKKTRHLPLRTLFDQAPDVLTAVRPCWVMSPLDVAQTLPPKPLFDLVIFDEASQVLPCDAMSALMRARRAMVAGDSRQLPPTTFFDGAGKDDDEEDEGSLTVFESILDVADSLLVRRPITWHYRSQDERLITFSNKNIYHGSLTTFPGAHDANCVTCELVEPRPGSPTDTRSNPDEVKKVVDLMVEHAYQRPNESLGVIAMGQYHADRIEETLRRRVSEENSPELERFFDDTAEERAFVKNLERVQGDERDAIILSIGYGKTSDGRLMYRFGPLNAQGGERRLNVAVTRARRRMTLVSSFSHTEMDPQRSSAIGVKQLRNFLKYAESGARELGGDDDATPLNPFELDVLDKLTRAGLDVLPQYGCSGYRIDFAVHHPTKVGRFVLAIEADGASYHSSATARDRDRLRQDHLERLGWRFCRIWSTDWFVDHKKEVDRIMATYQRAIAQADTAQPPVAPSAQLEGDIGDAVEEPQPQKRGLPPPLPKNVPIDEHSESSLVSLARWVMSDGLLRTDDQIFEEMFARLGYGRRGNRIRDALHHAIQLAKSS